MPGLLAESFDPVVECPQGRAGRKNRVDEPDPEGRLPPDLFDLEQAADCCGVAREFPMMGE